MGFDNAPSLGFATLLNIQKVYGDDVRVVAIAGDDPTQTQSVADRGAIPSVVASAARCSTTLMPGLSSTVVHRSTSRMPDHCAEAGLPVFIDKPLATDLAAATEFLEFAKAQGSVVSSSSTLRWVTEVTDLSSAALTIKGPLTSTFSGPCDFESPYDGAFFWHSHRRNGLGRGSGAVRLRTIRVGAGRTVVIENIDKSRTVLNLDPALNAFYGQVVGRSDAVTCRAAALPPDLPTLVDMFVEMVPHHAPLATQQLLEPVAILGAIVESDRLMGDWVGIG